MATPRRITADIKYSKNYKTASNAVKAIEREISKYDESQVNNYPMRYLIMMIDGRHVPVTLPETSQTQVAIQMAHNGFKMVG